MERSTIAAEPFRTIEWVGELDGYVRLIDQTLLPTQVAYLDIRDKEAMREAIYALRVRGAPAIGVAGAMGLVVEARKIATTDRPVFLAEVDRVVDYLAAARPTAVNLAWALRRVQRLAHSTPPSLAVADIKLRMLKEAKDIRDEDAAMCHAIGAAGMPLIAEGAGVLTHCNAGGLATSELGTALAPLYLAHRAGRRFKVFADETRPLLQGARLTSWELAQAGIDVTVLCDNMAGQLMASGRVQVVIVGADRIAANGDTANKIGTYSVAVLAQAHGIPFYVAAPSSTFDLACPTGKDIPIEQRSEDEIRRGFGKQTVPDGIPCYCPAFDVTPARLINGIVTERGIVAPVTADRIREIIGPALGRTP
jgi:methylthioribose-1-phosphate isomerase